MLTKAPLAVALCSAVNGEVMKEVVPAAGSATPEIH